MAAVGATIVTVASVASLSSIVYQLSRLMLSKAAESVATAALAVVARQGGAGGVDASPGRVQYVLMELDVEARIKAIRSLLECIENEHVEMEAGSHDSDFIHVCVNNVREVMETVELTLGRIQQEMDDHARRWLNNYRSMDVIDDLELLKAQCRTFDKRVDTLIQCLKVPTKSTGSHHSVVDEGTSTVPVHERILQQSVSTLGLAQQTAQVERMKSALMAERAMEDANLISSSKSGGIKTATSTATPKTKVLFEDPVFL